MSSKRLETKSLTRAGAALLWLAVFATPAVVQAQEGGGHGRSVVCPGDCSVDMENIAKAVEKYVKKSWKAVRKCAKKAKPACPELCPMPTAADFGLSAECTAHVDCRLGTLAYDALGASWGGSDLMCALAPAGQCGNARAKAAGSLLVKKLKRRRTSKMHKFAKDRSVCAAKADKKGACDGALICASAAAWVDGVFPATVKSKGSGSVSFSAASDGEGVAVLTLSASGADWINWGAESVVVEYDLDGVAQGSIVLYGGADATDYRVQLGAVTAGEHSIGLHHAKKLSPAKNSPFTVHGLSTVVVAAGDPDYEAMRYAPRLLGIDTKLNALGIHRGNAASDVPLIMYVRSHPGAGQTTYEYVMIWSNEDGGTGFFPEVLMSQWGRPHDIESILEVDVADSGEVLAMRYRVDENGTWPAFAGAIEGTHPLLRTSSQNGLIADDGDSTLRFALAPYIPSQFILDGTRERALMLDPVSYAVGAKEMIREYKVEGTANPDTPRISDLRNYLFVEMDIDVDLSGRVLRAAADVAATTYASDHFQPPAFIDSLALRVGSGKHQVAIELPPGTTMADIEQVEIQGLGTMTGTLNYLDAFMLGSDFMPGPVHINFSGAMTLSGYVPTWTIVP